ncbi:YdcF family protein [Saprospira sp. CCB-QB6]|uniref:YdcF family protein n=1 Tax=Saprospira sp. CCB-QB6 TaxID=3023936 RepID=UPI00234A085D|nr:YdcF family protein [Saprospira sp. CCB-QB6]WCL82066.1 YdcF family protein [Saprospira sp. CCB-QB6]
MSFDRWDIFGLLAIPLFIVFGQSFGLAFLVFLLLALRWGKRILKHWPNWGKLYFLLFSLGFASWLGFSFWLVNGVYQPLNEDFQAEYILVLGAGVRADGSPKNQLRYRLDKALELAQLYPQAKLILSGGQGADEPLSEAQAMQNYLVQGGLDKTRIHQEEQSTSTQENLDFSTQKFPQLKTAPTILLSSDYHVKRARFLAQKKGFQNIREQAAPTPFLWLLNQLPREYLAFLKDFLFSL